MPFTLQEVFQRYYPCLADAHRLPKYLRAAARAIMDCRTARLGGHVHACPLGHVERVYYNSCRHRACPQCGRLAVERWLDSQQRRLLACAHYHVVFTISDHLHGLWRMNRRLMTNLLFHSARDTLFELLGKPGGKFYIGKPGVSMVLHTWGRSMHLHPHVHCLLPAGGLSSSGEWSWVRKKYLVPYQLARHEFRERYLRAIRRSLRRGELRFPPGQTREQVERTLRRAGEVKWNVRVLKPYEHGKGLLTYLARYMRGIPLKNRQIESIDRGDVSFRYTAHEDGKDKRLKLSADRFIWRVLEHVPEPGTQVVRHYGIYARQKAAELAQCRSLLGQAPPRKQPKRTWDMWWQQWTGENPLCCPVCGGPLQSRRIEPHQGAPPLREGLSNAA